MLQWSIANRQLKLTTVAGTKFVMCILHIFGSSFHHYSQEKNMHENSSKVFMGQCKAVYLTNISLDEILSCFFAQFWIHIRPCISNVVFQNIHVLK